MVYSQATKWQNTTHLDLTPFDLTIHNNYFGKSQIEVNGNINR